MIARVVKQPGGRLGSIDRTLIAQEVPAEGGGQPIRHGHEATLAGFSRVDLPIGPGSPRYDLNVRIRRIELDVAPLQPQCLTFAAEPRFREEKYVELQDLVITCRIK